MNRPKSLRPLLPFFALGLLVVGLSYFGKSPRDLRERARSKESRNATPEESKTPIADEIKAEILKSVESETHPYTPEDVYPETPQMDRLRKIGSRLSYAALLELFKVSGITLNADFANPDYTFEMPEEDTLLMKVRMASGLAHVFTSKNHAPEKLKEFALDSVGGSRNIPWENLKGSELVNVPDATGRGELIKVEEQLYCFYSLSAFGTSYVVTIPVPEGSGVDVIPKLAQVLKFTRPESF